MGRRGVEKNESDPISLRLDALIRLIVEYQKRKENLKIGEQILILESAGLPRSDIARILGVKSTSIPSMLPKRARKTQ